MANKVIAAATLIVKSVTISFVGRRQYGILRTCSEGNKKNKASVIARKYVHRTYVYGSYRRWSVHATLPLNGAWGVIFRTCLVDGVRKGFALVPWSAQPQSDILCQLGRF